MTVSTIPLRTGMTGAFPNTNPRTVAFFGDSITQSGGQVMRNGYGCTTVNGFTSSNWSVMWADPETPSGAGSWVYDATAKTATWAAFGESAGVAVDVSRSGIYYLPSSTANHGITVAWDGSVTTQYASGTTTVTVPTDGNQMQALLASRSYAVCALMIAGPSWRVARTSVYPFGIAIGGVPGFSSASLVAAAWQTDQISSDVDVICIGTNDVASGIAPATIIANIEQVVLKRLVVGVKRIGLCTIPPRNSATAAQKKVRAQVNRWIADFAAATAGVVCLDVSTAVSDPSSGDWASGYSSDGVHPANIGAWAMGKVIATWLLSMAASTPRRMSHGDLYDSTYNPYGALFTTAGYTSFEGTGGTAGTGASGTVPTAFNLNRYTGSGITAVGSKVARTDNVGGSWYQLELSSASGDDSMRLYSQANNQSLSTYGLSAGDEIEAWLEVNIPASSGLKFADILISWTGVAGRYIRTFNDSIYSNAALQDSPGVFWLRTLKSTIPVGATAFGITFIFGTSSGGSATVQLGHFSINKVRSL